MRKLASIVTIATAEPIPGSDRLDVVTMKLARPGASSPAAGEFKPGDTAVYFEIDSALPADDERYAFLHDRCLRSWSDKHGKVHADRPSASAPSSCAGSSARGW
jgi:hypothetical protein